jgi:predicted pyridoxine 5'-phosphate oxidase superfamily flavin-nucleotide-binding protein
MRQLMPQGYRARPEQVVLFTVTAWDVNCPQHIPRRFEAGYVREAIELRDLRIAALEAEVERLRGGATKRRE